MRLLASSLLLSLAWFGAINVVASVFTWLIARRALSGNAPLGPSALLLLRLWPASVSALFVAVLFLPGHLKFEPSESDESFGLLLFTLSAIAAGLLLRSLFRVFQVAASSVRIDRALRADDVRTGPGIHEVPGYPGVSLAGVFRARVIVGSAIRNALTTEELAVAIAHEEAHRASRDNLKRCLMFCSPDLFGLTSIARRIENEWRAQSECQADSLAVAGDERRATYLAAALVKVAKIAVNPQPALQSPVWSTFHETVLLEARVRRLLSDPAPVATYSRLSASVVVSAASALMLTALFASNAGAAHQIHRATEALVKLLP